MRQYLKNSQTYSQLYNAWKNYCKEEAFMIVNNRYKRVNYLRKIKFIGHERQQR